jgi:hypothetical protein
MYKFLATQPFRIPILTALGVKIEAAPAVIVGFEIKEMVTAQVSSSKCYKTDLRFGSKDNAFASSTSTGKVRKILFIKLCLIIWEVFFVAI